MKARLTLVILSLFSAHSMAAETAGLSTAQQKLGYTIGYQIGQSFKQQGLDIDPDAVAMAIKDALTGVPQKLTQEDMQTVVQAQQEHLVQKNSVQGDANKSAGEAFLAANKTKEGVVTLPSGVQYKVITKGTGAKPKTTDTIAAHYRGTLIDGKEFDSSYKRGEPATFPVGGVIKGWQEILPMMEVGSKWQVFIPAEHAYGETGAGADIGPNSALIFDVELVSIK